MTIQWNRQLIIIFDVSTAVIVTIIFQVTENDQEAWKFHLFHFMHVL